MPFLRSRASVRTRVPMDKRLLVRLRRQLDIRGSVFDARDETIESKGSDPLSNPNTQDAIEDIPYTDPET